MWIVSFIIFVSTLLNFVALGQYIDNLVQPTVKLSKYIKNLVIKDDKVTDKFTFHTYDLMYGLFLVPLSHEAWIQNKKVKLLEIGLGCDMNYGAGASVTLWQKLFGDHLDLWEAEYNSQCVDKYKAAGHFKDINILVGDQGNNHTLQDWVTISGGNFDVIIDDGGHRNTQIKTSFDILFYQALKPGGLYVIEDLQVGRHKSYCDPRYPVMSDIIQSWNEQLIIPTPWMQEIYGDVIQRRLQYPLPKEIQFIFCQQHACVIGKRN